MMAPINDGTIAIPAILGPQEPNNVWPSADPTKPATTFSIIPIEEPFIRDCSCNCSDNSSDDKVTK